MSEDMIMLLIRVVVIVFPASFTCFILGFLYGKGKGYNAGYDTGVKLSQALNQPPGETEYVTRLTSRNVTKEF